MHKRSRKYWIIDAGEIGPDNAVLSLINPYGKTMEAFPYSKEWQMLHGLAIYGAQSVRTKYPVKFLVYEESTVNSAYYGGLLCKLVWNYMKEIRGEKVEPETLLIRICIMAKNTEEVDASLKRIKDQIRREFFDFDVSTKILR